MSKKIRTLYHVVLLKDGVYDPAKDYVVGREPEDVLRFITKNKIKTYNEIIIRTEKFEVSK